MRKGDASDLDPTRAPSVFDIDVLRVSRVYAEALIDAAEESDKVNVIWEQLVTLFGTPVRRSESPADPAALIASTVIPRGRREEILQRALKGRMDDLLLNFIMVLHHHHRLQILRPVASVYRDIMDERTRRVRVSVRSAVPLTDDQRKEIKQMAQVRFNLDPVLVESVEPELLGGLRLQVGDRVIDATVRARLDSIKDQLLARSSYAIRRR